jgi:hypothetical protein
MFLHRPEGLLALRWRRLLLDWDVLHFNIFSTGHGRFCSPSLAQAAFLDITVHAYHLHGFILASPLGLDQPRCRPGHQLLQKIDLFRKYQFFLPQCLLGLLVIESGASELPLDVDDGLLLVEPVPNALAKIGK